MVTADELPERLAALLRACGIVVRSEPNPTYAFDDSACPGIREAFKAALARAVQGADWDVVSVHAGLPDAHGRHDPEVQVHAWNSLAWSTPARVFSASSWLSSGRRQMQRLPSMRAQAPRALANQTRPRSRSTTGSPRSRHPILPRGGARHA